MATNIAIVTTIKADEVVIDYFYNYHMNIGVCHFFFFFDDPNDELILKYKTYNNVTVIPNDSNLIVLYQKFCKNKIKRLERIKDDKLFIRHILNAEVAISLSRGLSIEWLLDIDVDELFYIEGMTLNDHLKFLNLNKIRNAKYLVNEAVPETLLTKEFFFENITLFKRNIGIRDLYKYDTKTDFQSYSSWKSAINVNYNYKPISVTTYENFNIPKFFRSILVKFFKHKYENKKNIIVNPMILHYCCCTFDSFCRKVLTFSQYDRSGFIQKALSEVVDIQSAELFYLNNCVFSDEAEVQKYIEAGLLFRMNSPLKESFKLRSTSY